MKGRWLAIGVIVLAIGAFALWRWHDVNTGTGLVRREIASAIRRHDMPEDAPWRDRRTQALVRAFYAHRHMAPAWTSGAGALDPARELAEVVTHAGDEGLNPDDYSAAELAAHWEQNKHGLLPNGEPRTLADIDLRCTIAAFHYMSDVYDGRISPKALDAEWVARPRRGDFDSVLTAALRRNTVKQTLIDLAPTQEGYKRLREARVRYAQIVTAGGWPTLPAGPPLRLGQRGRRVATLRNRLVASGDLDRNRGAAVFDRTLENAVKRWQVRSGRDPDGVVSDTERVELNVPAAYRLRQIELNMERWRWAPRSFGDRYLIVNIPEYALHVVERGRPVLDMRVVVGKALTATPVFSDVMTAVVINPTWSVPASIVQNEFAAAIRQDRDYLAKSHIRVFDRASESTRERDLKEIDASAVDWSDTTELQHLYLRQDAGEGNALGRMKFLLPNRFDVYLHDTPAGELFAREDRSFSHGCVRVEDPMALARYVLRGSEHDDPDDIRGLIESDSTVTLKVPKPLPVHIVYFTAFVDDDGIVGFRPDVYGIDQNLIEQLQSRTRARVRSAQG